MWARWGTTSFFLCSLRRDGQPQVWVWATPDIEEPEKFACGVVLADKTDYMVCFRVPVYPMTQDKKKVLREENCVNVREFFVKTPFEVQGAAEERWKEHYSKFIKRADVFFRY